MKKIILFTSLLCFSLKFNAQNIDPIKEEAVVVEPQDIHNNVKKAVEYLLSNKELLNIKVDTRFDYQGKFGEHETEESSFRTQAIKLVFNGEIAPGVRYLVRQRLNKSQDASLKRDNHSSATDFAFIELDAGDKWTFRMGKQAVLLGTFELDYNPADVYLSTLINDDLDGYKTGVNAAYKTGKQIFNLQVINSDAPQFASEKYKKKAFAGIFLWQGDLFNETLKTRYGYGAFQHDGSKYYNWLTLGHQLNLNKFTAELDFYMGDRNINFSPVVTEEKFVREQAISLNFMYNLEKFKPILKGTWNKRRDQATASSYINAGVQAGLEYYPFTDPLLKDLRFHAVYVYNKNSFHGVYNTIDDINNNTVIVGMRWLFKVM